MSVFVFVYDRLGLAKVLHAKQCYKRVGKASLLLNSWRQLLKGIATDGCGGFGDVDATVMKRMVTDIQLAQDYCDFCYSVHTTLTTIPNITNNKKRQEATSNFLKEMKTKKFDMGDSLRLRLQGLMEGAEMEDVKLDTLQEELDASEAKKAAEGNSPEVQAVESVGNEEAPAKKARTEG